MDESTTTPDPEPLVVQLAEALAAKEAWRLAEERRAAAWADYQRWVRLGRRHRTTSLPVGSASRLAWVDIDQWDEMGRSPYDRPSWVTLDAAALRELAGRVREHADAMERLADELDAAWHP